MTILGLGVAAQVLADRLEIPSVFFLILAGILVGPEGLDVLGLDVFSGPEPLSAIVGLSVAIFEVVVGSGTQFQLLVSSFLSRLGTGLLVGISTAGILLSLLDHLDLSPSNAVRNSRLIVLVGAIATYGIASEAGTAAVATAGIILGTVDMPYVDEIAVFRAISR